MGWFPELTPVHWVQPNPIPGAGDRGFEHPFLLQDCLDLWTFDDIDNIGHLEVAPLHLLCNPQLDFSCNILIFKSGPPCMAKAMEEELIMKDIPQDPFSDVSCVVYSMPLSFRTDQ